MSFVIGIPLENRHGFPTYLSAGIDQERKFPGRPGKVKKPRDPQGKKPPNGGSGRHGHGGGHAGGSFGGSGGGGQGTYDALFGMKSNGAATSSGTGPADPGTKEPTDPEHRDPAPGSGATYGTGNPPDPSGFKHNPYYEQPIRFAAHHHPKGTGKRIKQPKAPPKHHPKASEDHPLVLGLHASGSWHAGHVPVPALPWDNARRAPLG